MVVPTMGTVIMFRLATSTPLRIASGTSRALPRPAPTRPLPSPTTMSAEKENFRPPFTTFATRFRLTTRSPTSERSLLVYGPRDPKFLSLELQSGFAGGLGQRLDPPVVEVAAAVEDDLLQARVDRLAGDRLADRLGGREVVLVQLQVDGRSRRQSAPAGVVDELDVSVRQAPEHGQARALGGAADLDPDPAVALVPRAFPVYLFNHVWVSFFDLERATRPACRALRRA